MASAPRTEAQDYPSDALLLDLVDELERTQADVDAPRILARADVPAHPVPLGPCVELQLKGSNPTSFVLSQRRSGGVMYVTVAGKRSCGCSKGVKKERSTVPWPRTRKTDRLRPVCLHRWLCMYMRGPPPSSDAQASHVCGNDACIAGCHLHWQTKADNLEDRSFHCAQLPLSPRLPRTAAVACRRFSRREWCL